MQGRCRRAIQGILRRWFDYFHERHSRDERTEKKARIPAEETVASHEFFEIPKNAKEREEFERQYMTPKELADRWKVSESAIHHRKANSNKVPRYRFGRAIRFIRQEIYEFEKSLPAQ
ncbi:MAG: hypothetical protein DMF72_10715 [Acidobacteria bacterium]|nr:MAG: hypothetical protein DMF72_10715 [Acidobacteriota bacterium]